MPEQDDADPPETTPRALHERLRTGETVAVLDLRDRDEVERWPIESADVEHLPFAQAAAAQARGDLAEVTAGLAEPVVVVCPVGEASAEVAGFLREAGVEATNLAGGMNAWARLLVGRDLDQGADGLAVRQYERPATGCLSYLVHDGSVGAVVDPLRALADRYVEEAMGAGVDLRYAVDTHVHADHISGVRAVADRTGADAVVPETATTRGLAFDARTVGDGDALDVGDAALTAVAAPGHTDEMTAFRADVPDHPAPPVVIAGDSLFVDGVARPDLQDADEAEAFAGRLYDTVHDRLLVLPAGGVLAPAHRGPGAPRADDGATVAPLGDVSAAVEALSLDRAAFVAHVTADAPPRPANHERIIAANLGREAVDDDAAFELELGPNNCAASAD